MFVSATYDRENKTVHYIAEDGTETLYIGGSFAWRLNNPGNLAKPGKKRVISSAIGYAQRTSRSGMFIIFPDVETGRREKIKLIKEVYGNSSLSQMIYAYAPPSDGNDTESYISELCQSVGMARDDVINSLDAIRFDRLVAGIAKKEGYIPGKIKILGKPVKIELRDAVKRPLANTEVKISDGKTSIRTKTNSSGELPSIYPGLFSGEFKLYIADMGKKFEKIFSKSVGELNGLYSLTAPYFVQDIQPDIHKKQKIQPKNVHIVKSGETLGGIASKYSVDIESLMSVNGIKNKNQIYARQHLDIPNGSTPKEEPPHPENKQKESAPRKPEAKPSDKRAPAPSEGHSKVKSREGVQVTPQRSEANHPAIVVSTAECELSGASWERMFLQSKSLDDLIDPFKTSAKKFIAALCEAKISVRISTTHRPTERSYLMYYAAQIARGKMKPENVPKWSGVNINWCHRNAAGEVDLNKSKVAAQNMVNSYAIGSNPVGKPSASNHNKRLAVDMTITNFSNKEVKNTSGELVIIKDFQELKKLGNEYGVHWYGSDDKPHWSFNGK
ncbi:LysM peptidoglycan-binding domain-containing protein [Iodobacter sp. CM08]|uniref:LysM peptidoglycan-binding domain-containing protein n=1 Tax=Iodobacter sp. CM08 TaxID=3085902 RepID=UPI0029822166|nr:LysM peptidoglycan-binding domain-containing protein [Iodobacter sp. CM08]MDW5419234.1 LysM peptidoglycan-binding domain-containing protein [Iodobacter sp. CM08]